MAEPTVIEPQESAADRDASTDLAPLERHVEVMPLVTDAEIDRIWRIAKALALSGMFKDATQAEQAFAKILLGRDLGLSPTQAMTGIHIIEGKPEVAGVTLAAFVERRDGYHYATEWRRPDGAWQPEEPEGDATGCRITFWVDGEDRKRGQSSWTIEDTKRANLDAPSRNGKPSNHTRFPRSMYWNRAMSQGVKRYMPECLGGVPVYFFGEIEAGADTPDRRQLGSGDGTGAEPGWQIPDDLIVEVEKGVQAFELDRATVQMQLNGQSRETVENWIGAHMPPLPAPEPVPDAEVVPDIDPLIARRACQERYETDPEFAKQADQLLDQLATWEAMDESGDGDRGEIAGRLDAIRQQMDAAGIPVNFWPASDGGGTEQMPI